MKKLGVVGHPISHSKSPAIHSKFAAQCQVDIQYEKYDIPAVGFEEFVNEFFAKGGTGLNVTVPHKESAFKISTPANERVKLAKAVNTLFIDEQGKLIGDNTDGPGLVKDFENNNIALHNKSILVLGAGGAVRGILPSLIGEKCSSITVANRTLKNAANLQKDFVNEYPIEVCDFESIPVGAYDLVINGTSLGLTGETPAISETTIGVTTYCYDLMYSSSATAFVRWSGDRGARKALDGLGMLVEQAAVSFGIWLGKAPETDEIIKEMRSE